MEQFAGKDMIFTKSAEMRAKAAIESTTAAINRQAQAEVRAAATAEAASKRQEAAQRRRQVRNDPPAASPAPLA